MGGRALESASSEDERLESASSGLCVSLTPPGTESLQKTVP